MISIADCLPKSWQKKIVPSPAQLIITGEQAILKQEGNSIRFDWHHMPSELKKRLAKHAYPLHLIVPDDWVLTRTVRLPLAAKNNLHQVIGFEIDRLTPFQPDQVYYDQQIVEQDLQEQTIDVNIAVIPAKKIDPILEILAQYRIPVDAIRSQLSGTLNLLPASSRPKIHWLNMIIRSFPYWLLLLLLLSLLGLPAWQKYQILQQLSQQEKKLRHQVQPVLVLREALDKKIAKLETIKKDWQKKPPMVEILNQLNQILPAHTSLQQMEMHGLQLKLRGLSDQASALIALFEKSPHFSQPKFLSPVNQRGDKELFDLTVQLKSFQP